MGIYLNPGNVNFKSAINSPIYVDKTGVVGYTNALIGTRDKYVCVCRPRRFGKSMAAEMLAAYYDKTVDSHELFHGFAAERLPDYEKHINEYNVLSLDMQWLRSMAKQVHAEDYLVYMQEKVVIELSAAYPGVVRDGERIISEALAGIYDATGDQFVIIIDEWDCYFREEKHNKQLIEDYIIFLRGMFKGSAAEKAVLFAYMTGILPIKKYKTESALNNFTELTMLNPGKLAPYVGFTEEEVKSLCESHSLSFDETKYWYDGYVLKGSLHVYSPKSITEAIRNEEFRSYWSRTESFESLKEYIMMNFDGLKDGIIAMLSGETVGVDTSTFENDLTSFQSKDDVLAVLIHLGYLGYNEDNQECFVPNEEIRRAFASSIKTTDWTEVIAAVKSADELLKATWNGDSAFVAETIDKIHSDATSVLSYNNENSLSCVISLAYYTATKYYTIHREFPSGKGFADLILYPRRGKDVPAIVVELKFDKDANGAIRQIKDKSYTGVLSGFSGNILLVGINYDKKLKKDRFCQDSNLSATKFSL